MRREREQMPIKKKHEAIEQTVDKKRVGGRERKRASGREDIDFF